MIFRIILFLLLSAKLLSQNLTTLKSSDTVYVYFDQSQSFPDLHLKTTANKTVKNYLYVFPDSKTLQFQVNLSNEYGGGKHKKEKMFFRKDER